MATAAAPDPAVRVVRLRADARIPVYMSAGAAGLDLHACVDADREIGVGQRALVGTGLAFAIPDGYEAQVRPRSGLAHKHGVTVLNAPGTIDSDYRGEVMVLLVNHGQAPFVVRAGDRIAQLVIAPVTHARLVEVEGLDATARGAGGYGSTGR